MGLLSACFISGAKRCVFLLKWVWTCVSVSVLSVRVCMHTYASRNTRWKRTITPYILSHRAGRSSLVPTSAHTPPFLTFLDTEEMCPDFSHFKKEFQTNFSRISMLHSGWPEKFSPLSWHLSESLNLTRPSFPFWVTGINNVYCDRAVQLEPFWVFKCFDFFVGEGWEKCKCYPWERQRLQSE